MYGGKSRYGLSSTHVYDSIMEGGVSSEIVVDGKGLGVVVSGYSTRRGQHKNGIVLK
jgi:hypothetical protein